MEGYAVFIAFMLLVSGGFLAWIARPWEVPRRRRTSHPTVEDAIETINRKAETPWRGNS